MRPSALSPPTRPALDWQIERQLPTYVYRLFDAFGFLLYVGIARNPQGRMAGHQRSKWWWDDVAYAEWAFFLDRSDAEQAERVAICTEHPIYNKIRPYQTMAWVAGLYG